MLKTECRSDSLNSDCSIVTHYYSGYKDDGLFGISLPSLKLIDTESGKIFEIKGLAEIKKLKQLLVEYIVISERTYK